MRRLLPYLLLFFVSSLFIISTSFGNDYNPLSGYRLLFADEFNAPAGEVPNPRHWGHDVGGHGWGNNELQYYSKNPQNAYHDGQGHLVIALRNEPHLAQFRNGKRYSSARLTTNDRFEIQHGLIEARLKVPSGQGLWPAFWMLGADFPKTPWPACGEIDIMEHVGNDPTRMHTNIHGPNFSGNNGLGQGVTLPNSEPFANAYHTVALKWEPYELTWYLDGQKMRTLRRNDIQSPSKPWVFNKPFFLLLNLATGGEWAGEPDASTVFPAFFMIDYVRVYGQSSVLAPY